MNEIVEYLPNMYATFWALIPPLVAIILALITKEVYSSLFIGIVMGGLFYGNLFQTGFSLEKSVLHIFDDGILGVLTDSYNVGILVFLVVLGIMVSMMNRAGGSAAFGEWAGKHIKTRIGAQLASILLGAMIHTGAAVASIRYASFALDTLCLSVIGRITLPTVRQLK